MNLNKKLQIVDRAASQIQSQNSFMSSKSTGQDLYQSSMKISQRNQFDNIFATPDSIFNHFSIVYNHLLKFYDLLNGAKSPYKSNKRIGMLMKNSPYFSQIGQVMNMETPASQYTSKFQRTFSMSSKPSSVTTAYTNAPSEFSVSKSIYSQRSKNEQSPTDKKQKSKLVGLKRQADKTIDQLEFSSKIRSKAGKYVLQNIRLRNKQTGQVMEFSLVDENKVEALRSALVSNFNTSNLEVEYDYATDCEQMVQSKKMLFEELEQAIENKYKYLYLYRILYER